MCGSREGILFKKIASRNILKGRVEVGMDVFEIVSSVLVVTMEHLHDLNPWKGSGNTNTTTTPHEVTMERLETFNQNTFNLRKMT